MNDLTPKQAHNVAVQAVADYLRITPRQVMDLTIIEFTDALSAAQAWATAQQAVGKQEPLASDASGRITITRDRTKGDAIFCRYLVEATLGKRSARDWTSTRRGAGRRGRRLLQRLREPIQTWDVRP